jgi:hypothetical protein
VGWWAVFAVDEADHIRVASSLAATFAKVSRMRLLELAELAAMSAERCAYMRAFLLRQAVVQQPRCAHARPAHSRAAHLALACTALRAAMAPPNRGNEWDACYGCRLGDAVLNYAITPRILRYRGGREEPDDGDIEQLLR